MNKNNENILLSFWLPFRKSNFINSIDLDSKDNLVNKIINFSFEYQLDIEAFNVHLNEAEHRSIFKLHDTKYPYIQRKNVHKHLTYTKENDIQFLGDVKRQGLSSRDTLARYRYKLSKTNEKNDNILTNYDQPIDINFLESKTNHLYLKFKFTKKSIKLFESLNFFENDFKSFTSSLLMSLEFELFIDEYGFYFIDTKVHKSPFFNIDEIFMQLFIQMFFSWHDGRFTILTYDQQHIVRDGLLFEYDIDNSNQNSKYVYTKEEKTEKIENFFKKIIKVYHYKDFEKNEYFDILPNKELVYILDQRNDRELQQKIYEIPFLEYAYRENQAPEKLIKKWIFNTSKYVKPEKIHFLYKLFLQKQIEKNAMCSFLEVSTSINYIGKIINKIKNARDSLRDLITDTTESVGEYDKNDNNEEKKLTEEQLARYTEKIFSRIPNLKTIDTFLQEAYYIITLPYKYPKDQLA